MGQLEAKDLVMVVDDEAEVLSFLTDVLEEAGFAVTSASDGVSALRTFYEARPKLAVVDLMMPKMDGIELCKRIRELSDVPIIFLSAKGGEADKVAGLEHGADDYLVKPVGPRELVARIKAALRRSRTPPLESEAPAYADKLLRMDFAKHEVHVGDTQVDLTPIEYRLLAFLVRNAGQVLSHEQLLDRVWGLGYNDPELVKWHISRLRRKLEADPENPDLIVTVRGVGYRYTRSA